MEDLIKIIVDNGLGIGSFICLIIYIYFDKKQVAKEKEQDKEFMKSLVASLNSNTDILKDVSDNQREMTKTLEKLSDRMENLENKVNKKDEV